jgi:hypothetical protein
MGGRDVSHYRNCSDEPTDDETARLIESALVEASGGPPIPEPAEIARLAAIERAKWSRREERQRTVQPNPRPRVTEPSVVVRRRHAKRRSD